MHSCYYCTIPDTYYYCTLLPFNILISYIIIRNSKLLQGVSGLPDTGVDGGTLLHEGVIPQIKTCPKKMLVTPTPPPPAHG